MNSAEPNSTNNNIAMSMMYLFFKSIRYYCVKYSCMQTKAILLFSGLILMFNSAKAQFPAELYLNSKVTYLGVDYTQCRMIGEELDFVSVEELVKKYFFQWNDMINKEPLKYDVRTYFDKSDIIYDLDMVNQKNIEVDPWSILNDKRLELKVSDVKTIINSYELQEDGLGLVFFAENYDKFFENAYYVFVVFDMSNSEILFTKRYKTQAMGVGFRNYWARSYYDLISDGVGFDMKKWLRKAKRKYKK